MKKVTVFIPDEDHQAAKELGEHGFFTEIVRSAIRYYILGENGSALLAKEAKDKIDGLRRDIRNRSDKERTKDQILEEAFEAIIETYSAAVARRGINWVLKEEMDAIRLGIFKKFHIVYSDDEMKEAFRRLYKKHAADILNIRTQFYEENLEMNRIAKEKGFL